MSEVIEKPLTYDELAKAYRSMCEDPYFANIPGKLELDTWGRIIMSPASNSHGKVQASLSQKLFRCGGQAFVEASVLTPAGVLVPDVAWASAEFMFEHGLETPFTRAPELCIEIASPSNSLKELNEKVAAYLAAGTVEAWIVFPQSRRFEFYGAEGRREQTSFAIDLAGLFD